MIRVMDALTDKLRWDMKVWDEEILAKWKVEAMNMKGRLISEMAWKWIVEELRWKSTSYWRTGYITTLETGSTIVKSNTLIDEGLRRELRQAVRPLLDVSDAEKDWHPGSGGKVLNLVHPSSYPLVYGRTRIVSDRAIGLDDYLSGSPDDGVVISIPETPVRDENDQYGCRRYEDRYPYPEVWSTKFQWLPCDVEFVGLSGSQVKIVSYINNLNPSKYLPLYDTIEKFITKSIEPWNEVLGWGEFGVGGDILRIEHDDEIKQTPEPPEFRGSIDHEDPESEEKVKQQIKDFLAQPDNPDYIPIHNPFHQHFPGSHEPYDMSFTGKWWHDDRLEFALWTKWERVRKTSHPEPGVDKTFTQWKEARKARLRPTLQEMFRARGLQVIVKLSSIELTPEKPSYEGGSWHLEGKMNEHIVATSIYYYDVDNVSDSRLDFRQEVQLDSSLCSIVYDAGNHGPIEDAYGARNLHDAEAIQEVGSVETRQGRLLVFPNIVQHRVEPFRLKDPTRPGHRRFLVLWLVDPHYRVISTRNVQPQQWEWWREKEAGTAASEAKEPGDWPMTRVDAEKIRRDLMAERTTVMDAVEGHFERYNFCEH